MKDKLIIGNKEFNSRFILGSGKFPLDKTKIVIENGGVEMATLALRRANVGVKKIFWTICQKGSRCCQTLQEQEMRRRLYVLQNLPENSGVEIL